MALEESPSRVESLGAEQAQCRAYAEQTFFLPAQFQPRDFRLPPRKLLARARHRSCGAADRWPLRFANLRVCAREATCIASPWQNEGRLALLAFCHGLLKFEPQNATSAKVTAAVSGKGLCKEACSARKGMGASQLWWWCRLSFFRGDGGQSASGAVKGEGGQSALELGLFVVCFCFETSRRASQLPGL